MGRTVVLIILVLMVVVAIVDEANLVNALATKRSVPEFEIA